MAHKVQPNQPRLTDKQLQDRKTQHYIYRQQLVDSLKMERNKENALNEQLAQINYALVQVREVIKFSNKHPKGVAFRTFPAGWAWSYGENKKDAMDQLFTDQKKFERDIEALKTQLKLCIEKQLEIESRLKDMPIFSEIKHV